MGGKGADLSVEDSASGIIATIARWTPAETGGFKKWNGEPHDW
jgi:hypothetical protein